ncbi:PEP-CTERM sorting domain-containing protein [Pelomonas sp. APW6]|uniref:PEP-CTERM sorting domain-containing protein n=1 Tax=Roseateles subflavus TaxID=3053353 RepID=A0ABT7LKV5_9BURK|nr:PEP-CTERM sorting domain-containing protein [Pelomonas sp. APW6]MDL5033503.1 PEP-CTERM sorting domain-containing protein [Pelomonas sp. APW6]
MKPTALALLSAALLLFAPMARAAPVATTAVPIPIPEEFVVAQQLHVDSSLDAIVMQLLGAGLFNGGAKLHYEGRYQVTESAPGVFSGGYLGMLTRSYLGEDWAIEYSSGMATDALLNKVWSLDSKGTWKKGPYKGKTFKDKGKIVEKTDNTADLDIEIETEGVTPKIKTAATGLKKVKGGGKLTVEGDFTVVGPAGETHEETVGIVLDQATKTFTSEVSSSVFRVGVVVLKNEGTFTVSDCAMSCFEGGTAFDITIAQVPEPATPLLLTAGVGGMLSLRRRRTA